MDLKYKVRTYNFWISLAAAILIVLRLLGQYFGFVVDSNLFMDIATAVCGVLVILGIIIMPTTGQNQTKTAKTLAKADKTTTQLSTSEQQTDKTCQEQTEECQNVTEIGQNQTEDYKEIQNETKVPVDFNVFDTDDVHPNLIDIAEEQYGAEIDVAKIEDTQIAVREAIEQLAKNPQELYELVKQILKDK